MPNVIVLGAGVMGLAAAYQAVRDGGSVKVIEAAPEPGGMAAHFDFGGISLERFYHFVCKGDQPTFDLLGELGIAGMMRWVPTSMGFYFNSRLQKFGTPLSLMRLSGTPLLTRLRYGLLAYVSAHRDAWPALERMSSREWITRWCGPRGYDDFWRALFDLKFYEYADNISAAWTWTRMRRIGRSRRSMNQEELGYIEGGSETLVKALVQAIRQGGGDLILGAPAERVLIDRGSVAGVAAGGQRYPAEAVISTVPTPLVSRLIPDLPADWRARYDAIRNIGICCVVLKLKRSVSPHFWVNLHGVPHDIPGFIEFSNLRPVGPTIIFLPYYMPVTNPKFSWPDQTFVEDALACISLVNPSIGKEDLIDFKVSRLRHAQPICEVGFGSRIPPIQTPFRGLQIADTCFYYPEDRGIAESVKLGREMAAQVPASLLGTE